MRQRANLETSTPEKSVLQNLAELFPRATPLRIPVIVRVTRDKGRSLEERATIEFGTSRMVFFESQMELEISDKLQLRNSDGSLDTEAAVVAVRVHDGRRAIAARFASEVRNWIVQG